MLKLESCVGEASVNDIHQPLTPARFKPAGVDMMTAGAVAVP